MVYESHQVQDVRHVFVRARVVWMLLLFPDHLASIETIRAIWLKTEQYLNAENDMAPDL